MKLKPGTVDGGKTAEPQWSPISSHQRYTTAWTIHTINPAISTISLPHNVCLAVSVCS